MNTTDLLDLIRRYGQACQNYGYYSADSEFGMEAWRTAADLLRRIVAALSMQPISPPDGVDPSPDAR